METVGLDAGLGDVLGAVESASSELCRPDTVPEVAEVALGQALALTRSSVAFLALPNEDGEPRRVFSRAADLARGMSAEDIEDLFALAEAPSPPGIRETRTEDLEVAGRTIGVIGIASSTGYTAMQARVFGLFSWQVAMALGLALQRERRAERVGRAHEAAVDVLLEVSRHERSGPNLADFYGRLTRSIAELVAAKKVLFWQLDDEQMLTPIAGAFGIDEAFLSGLGPIPCAPGQEDAASRVVFHDEMLETSRADDPAHPDLVLNRLNVGNAIAVPWRAGDNRLGLVAAYDSLRDEGFSREDAWVLQMAGLAAGLVWQLRHTDTDLKNTVERLQRVDAARQLLLKNVSTAVDKARRRFAAELHDDALQKLTAAELQLERVRDSGGAEASPVQEAKDLLVQTEDALRRLLFEVRPPALEMPGGFEETINERIAMLKSLTGAEVEVKLELPEDLSLEYRSALYGQLAEAIANIEKHAAATRVRISLQVKEGGVHGIVEDNGRGFVVSERERLPGHLGLLTLNERALLASGWNNTQSAPGLGTTIEFWFPIAGEQS